MSKTNFDWEENIILAIYRADSREESIEKMEISLQCIGDEEMAETVKGVIAKVKNLTDEEYLSIDFEVYQLALDSWDSDNMNGGVF